MAKAASWDNTDAHARKRGEQIGLDTLVVHAVNVEDQVSGAYPGAQANAVSPPPGYYVRKNKTYRN